MKISALRGRPTAAALVLWVTLVLTTGIVSSLGAWAEAPAAEPHCHDMAEGAAEASAVTPALEPGTPSPVEQLTISDVPVVDQNGRKLHFFRDLVAGRKVAMNFVFTTCTTICPPMGAHFSKVGKLVAEAGDAVSLISVSIDPATDTPERLKAWQGNFGHTEGWTLVTGTKQDITRLLRDLRVYSATPAAHAPVVLLGDGASGRFQRIYGLTPPADLLATLDLLSTSKVAGKEKVR